MEDVKYKEDRVIRKTSPFFNSPENRIRYKSIPRSSMRENFPMIERIIVISSNIVSIKTDNDEFYLPENLKRYRDQIEKSRYIYDLKDNWDEEDSKGYLKSTWDRVVEYIVYYAKENYSKDGSIISKPIIMQGTMGEIDVRFESGDFSLLINFPENLEIKPSYNCISIKNPKKLNYSDDLTMGENDYIFSSLLKNFIE